MKKLNVSVVLALSIIGAGCSDRKEEFLDGYAVAEVVDMTDKNYEPHNHFEYISGHTSRNTSEAITFLQKELKKRSESSEAIANAYETKSGFVQCVIVQRADLSKVSMNHEMGHCFNLIYFDKLRKKNPSALATILQNKTGYRYLMESFAEVASSTIAYGIDGDKLIFP